MIADRSVANHLLEGNTDLAAGMARYIADFKFEDLDADALAATRRLMLDCLGAAVAAVDEPGCVELRELVEEWGGVPQASLIGSGAKVPAHNAVAVNAALSRALEFDDVHETALIHATATIVPAVLGIAESSPFPVSGRDLLAAVAVGIDAHTRLSSAPRTHVSGPGYRPRGMSCTYQIGTMLSAALLAKLRGASAGTILSAFGMGYSNAAGNQQVIADGTLGVRLQQGLSAGNGIVAGQLALRGVAGPHHPLEGKFGYYAMYWHDDYDREPVLADLGEHQAVVDVSIKPYPSCKYTHTTIAAALEARNDPKLRLSDIERIVLRVDNAEYFSLVCDPIEPKRRPQVPVDAQFSLPYCVAAALLRGDLGLDDFRQEALSDRAVLNLVDKTDCVLGPSESLGRALPTPGRVEIRLRDGTVIVATADYAPGHPKRPFTWEQSVQKFKSCAQFPGRQMPAAQVDEFVRQLELLEGLADARALLSTYLVW